MNRNKIVFGVFLAFASLLFGTNTAFAQAFSDDDPIMQKIIYTTSKDCYTAGLQEGGLVDEIQIGKFFGKEEDLRDRLGGLAGTDSGPRISATVKWYGNNDISCETLLTEKTANKFSANTVNDLLERAKILEKMQYRKITVDQTQGKKCASFKYDVSSSSSWTARDSRVFEGTKADTNYLCVEKGTNGGWIASVDADTVVVGDEAAISFIDAGDNYVMVKYKKTTKWWEQNGAETKEINGFSNASNSSVALATIWNKVVELVGSNSGQATQAYNYSYFASCGKYNGSLDGKTITCPNNRELDISLVDKSAGETTYQKPSNLATVSGADSLISGLSNNKYSYYRVIFTPMEKYRLYQAYLQDVYKASTVCYEYAEGGAGIQVKLWDGGRGRYNEYCYVTVDSDLADNTKVNGVGENGYFGVQLSLYDMIGQLNALNLTDEPPATINVDDGNTPSDESAEGCYGAGLESQGWILCPTLNNMTSVVDGVDKIVGDMLSVDTNYFNQDNKTYTVWEIFRNIANTAMVVILLVIIFSQLTGYGIDNYGIKKMLPKLVLMAILINLSFFICEIIIDISNILGVGLNSLFRGMGDATYTGGGWVDDLLGSIFTVAAAGGATAGAAVTVGSALAGGSGPMIIISMILVLLVALVSVLMFFLAVGARLVIIILFTAISPLAFACYILPNTQKMFKKWWDIFKAALIVYPICGALYGLSFLIRSMVHVQGAGNQPLDQFPLMLVAAAAPFLPFLVLPSLLKGALAGLGAVSGAITSIGNGLRKGLSRGNQTLQGTDAYKRQSEDAARRRQENNMRRWLNGYQRRKGNLGDEDMSKSQRMRAARYTEALKKFESQDSAAKTVLAESEFQNALESDLQDAWKKEYLNGGDDLDALTNVMLSRYGAGAANYMANIMDENSLVGPTGARNANIERSLGILRNNLYSNDKNSKLLMDKTPDAHRMITTLGSNGNLRNYADNKITTKQSDVIGTTSGSIERMVKYGSFNDLLGKGSAQSMLSSNEPSIVNGLTDPKKRKAVMAQAYLDSHYDGKFDNANGLTIDDLANAYAKEAEQIENTRATAEQEQRQVAQQQLEELRKLNEQLGHGGNGNSSTSGQSGDQTNPTDGQIL